MPDISLALSFSLSLRHTHTVRVSVCVYIHILPTVVVNCVFTDFICDVIFPCYPCERDAKQPVLIYKQLDSRCSCIV